MRTWSRCIRAGKQGGGLEPRPNPWLEFLHGMNGWIRGDRVWRSRVTEIFPIQERQVS